mmetsp:Transcript_22616/g.70874  ORF Transcript_22616/g.70874 Transcript_22616/m.70874 type:complete len:395 (-) Transcript_22616:1074-2258(-)
MGRGIVLERLHAQSFQGVERVFDAPETQQFSHAGHASCACKVCMGRPPCVVRSKARGRDGHRCGSACICLVALLELSEQAQCDVHGAIPNGSGRAQHHARARAAVRVWRVWRRLRHEPCTWPHPFASARVRHVRSRGCKSTPPKARRGCRGLSRRRSACIHGLANRAEPARRTPLVSRAHGPRSAHEMVHVCPSGLLVLLTCAWALGSGHVEGCPDRQLHRSVHCSLSSSTPPLSEGRLRLGHGRARAREPVRSQVGETRRPAQASAQRGPARAASGATLQSQLRRKCISRASPRGRWRAVKRARPSQGCDGSCARSRPRGWRQGWVFERGFLAHTSGGERVHGASRVARAREREGVLHGSHEGPRCLLRRRRRVGPLARSVRAADAPHGAVHL